MEASPLQRKRYAICGLSNRAIHEYALPLIGRSEFIDAGDDFSGLGELVAIVDIDTLRAQRFLEQTAFDVSLYSPDDFERMIKEQRPDVVIVAGPDFTHAEYTVAALLHNIDVIVEKPLAHTAAAARLILDAEARSDSTVTVAHNARYEPSTVRIKELVQSGAIGRIVAIDIVEGLDTYHGASFFRRWNRRREFSGGLTVTKGCHTIDMISWILGDAPESVYAIGGLNFYGAQSPHRPLGLTGEPLAPQDEIVHNPYAQRWSSGRVPEGQQLFTGQWQKLGYPTQYPEGSTRSIFDDEIDVEDTYSSVFRFRGGASMTYSLCFSLPWEGHRLGITGTKGRIETDWVVYRDNSNPSRTQTIRIDRLFGAQEVITIAADPEGHDVADARIRHDLFLGPSSESTAAGIHASAFQGAVAVAAGEAMWRSVASDEVVSVGSLLGLASMPEWSATIGSLDGSHPDALVDAPIPTE